MGRAHFTAVAAAGVFGLTTVIVAAQAPALPAAGQKPPAAQNPPPVPADPSLAQGQGRGASLSIENAPPGMHGVHIHGTGRCEDPDFKSAGGHFDPGPAGNPDPYVNHPYHMGDLLNLTVNAQGIGQYNVFSTRVTMGGPTGLFDADGSAIVCGGIVK